MNVLSSLNFGKAEELRRGIDADRSGPASKATHSIAKHWKVARRWMVIVPAAFALGVAGSHWRPAVVVGNSMAPTLRSGGLIWLDRNHYRNHTPVRGEVVVFDQEGEPCVKRIYRTPGETVNWLVSGTRWLRPVRDNAVKELRRRLQRSGSQLRVLRMVVPPDMVVVMGDNPTDSTDSREYGPIAVNRIMGRAMLPVSPDLLTAFEWQLPPRALRDA